jgi:hypothetical protein
MRMKSWNFRKTDIKEDNTEIETVGGKKRNIREQIMCYGFNFLVEDKQRDDMGIIGTPYTERWTCS